MLVDQNMFEGQKVYNPRQTWNNHYSALPSLRIHFQFIAFICLLLSNEYAIVLSLFHETIFMHRKSYPPLVYQIKPKPN